MEERDAHLTDPQLSQAYRDAAHPQPSAAVDARILDAARQAVAVAPVKKRSRWSFWAVPLSSAAVLVLGMTLLFEMQYQAPRVMDSPSDLAAESTARMNDAASAPLPAEPTLPPWNPPAETAPQMAGAAEYATPMQAPATMAPPETAAALPGAEPRGMSSAMQPPVSSTAQAPLPSALPGNSYAGPSVPAPLQPGPATSASAAPPAPTVPAPALPHPFPAYPGTSLSDTAQAQTQTQTQTPAPQAQAAAKAEARPAEPHSAPVAREAEAFPPRAKLTAPGTERAAGLAAPPPASVAAPGGEKSPTFTFSRALGTNKTPSDATLETPVETPEHMVETIRRLVREDRLEEARKAWEKLRREYPKYPLPPDLMYLPIPPQGNRPADAH